MRLLLQYIKYRNVRDFRKVDISFQSPSPDNTPHHVSLIQMPNGTGKTTTIQLLQTIFSGKQMHSEEVFSFKPTSFDAQDGTFEIGLLLDDERYSLRIELDYTDGSYKYKTSRPSETGGGIEPGHNLPTDVKSVIDHRFAKLFIFDGEMSAKLLDRKETEAERSISSLHYLDRLESLRTEIDEIVETRVDSAKSTVQHKKGLKNLKARLRTFRQKKRELGDRLRQDGEALDRLRSDRSECLEKRDSLFAKSETVRKRSIEIRDMIAEKRESIRSQTRELLEGFRRPSNFSRDVHMRLTHLADSLVKLKLPKTISREFFKELSNAKHCVCGIELSKERRAKVLANSELYLAEDSITILNTIKDAIRNMGAYEDKSMAFAQLAQAKAELQERVQEQASLQLQLDEKTQKRIDELDSLIDKTENQIKDLSLTSRVLKETDPTFIKDYELDWKANISQCEKRIVEYEKKIAEASGTVDFRNRAVRLKKMISDIVSQARVSIKDELIQRANDRISAMLGSEEIRISKIDGCVVINDKEGVSQGQSLAVAYAFLATLFEDSPHHVPFVVDSPAGSLDLEVRREVSDLIPRLFDQLVVFIISSERDGFMEGIEKMNDVQYFTIVKNLQKLGDVQVSEDRDVFMNFHSEEATT